MTIQALDTRPPGWRRWLRGAAVVPAVAIGLVGPAIGSPALASAQATAPDPYAVCLPMPCMPVPNAAVTGTVVWDQNVNNFQATNSRLPLVTVLFTQLDNGVVIETRPFRVLRGETLSGSTRVGPTTDTMRISLCPSASEAPQPNCASVVAAR
ncbi:hypothetical protein ACTMTJ_08405 [Phytohabitans sp. LJ34]|uniref:hypothetical protein n=1 Tax=Phytohabitans sp. LJ34 TaxID=3452217 RepID=UPI003F8CAC0A